MTHGWDSARAAIEYRQVNAYGAFYVEPHRLTKMLMDGALSRIAAGRGALAVGDTFRKDREVTKCIAIIDGLVGALDMENGGELAQNFQGLYEYIQRRLWHANTDNDPTGLEEAASLMSEIRDAWDAIGPRPNDGAAHAHAGDQPRINATG